MRDTEDGIDCDTCLPVACTVSISSEVFRGSAIGTVFCEDLSQTRNMQVGRKNTVLLFVGMDCDTRPFVAGLVSIGIHDFSIALHIAVVHDSILHFTGNNDFGWMLEYPFNPLSDEIIQLRATLRKNTYFPI